MITNINNQWLRDLHRTWMSLAFVGVAVLHSPLNCEVEAAAVLEEITPDRIASEDGVDNRDSESRHRHEPIVVRSKPVIERLPVSVIDPVDVAIGRSGSIYVADAKADTVFRIASDGVVDTPVRETPGLTRICLDQDNHLYVLVRESKYSRILQVTPNGLSVELGSVPFEATSMARLASGEILLATRLSPNLTMIATDGTQSLLATLPDTILDIAVSSSEQIQVLHGSGQVSYVSLDGNTSINGWVPADSRRLFALPEGEIAALSAGAGIKGEIVLVERQRGTDTDTDSNASGKPARNTNSLSPRIYSTVPAGTQAVAFDDLGNMSLVNPELRAVTRVTTTMMVPCPHCGRPTKLILSPNGPAAPRGRAF